MIVFKEKDYSKFSKITKSLGDLAFNTKYKLITGANKIVNKTIPETKDAINKTAWGLKLNPRKTIGDGIQNGTAYVVKNPDVAAAQVVSPFAYYGALSHVVDPGLAGTIVALPLPGPGAAYAAGRFKIGGSPKILERAGEAVKNSKGYREVIDTALGKQPKAYLGLPKTQSKWDKIKYNIKSGVAGVSDMTQTAGKAVANLARFSDTEEKRNNMKIFKEKQYTLEEGHYTGPKDLDDVPGAFKTIAGATALGYAAGAVVDKVTEDSRKPKLADEPTSWKTRGAQAGFVAGVMSKLLLNTIHNPMDNIKFQELDKALRRSFGMYRASGITIGDSRENRERMKESFVINSKKIMDFKINVTVAKGKLVMYTLGLSEKQEEDLNDILDYYCKKYFGMKYTSTPLKNKGSWSITIVFTNHQVAANFLVEVGEVLGVRQNILNDDLPESDTKMFSWVPFFDKSELKDIFSKSALKIISGKIPFSSKGLTDMLVEGLGRLKALECSDIGIKSSREDYGNKFLEKVIKKLDPRGIQWTTAKNDSDLNLYLFRGTLMVCASHGSKEESLMKELRELKPVVSKSAGAASLWTYQMKTPGDLEVVLRKIIGTKAKLNIYVP